MSDINKVLDGDTLDIEDQTHRVAGINTPESVHPDESRNTPEGEVASRTMKQLFPEGSDVSVNQHEIDRFGRRVSSVKRNINGVEIDWGLVALDQELSQYYIQYGSHSDPMLHDQYKEYFADYAPYNYGDVQPKLPPEEVKRMEHRYFTLQNTLEAMEQGQATQEDVDAALVDLYKDPAKVVSYRHQIKQWDREVDMSMHDASVRFAHDIALQDPVLREQYNRAVRNSHLETIL